jgi:hypothetical protein
MEQAISCGRVAFVPRGTTNFFNAGRSENGPMKILEKTSQKLFTKCGQQIKVSVLKALPSKQKQTTNNKQQNERYTRHQPPPQPAQCS